MRFSFLIACACSIGLLIASASCDENEPGNRTSGTGSESTRFIAPAPLDSATFAARLEQSLSTVPKISRQENQGISARAGLSLIPRNYQSSTEAWLQALQVADHLGVEVLQLPSGYWYEDEPTPGSYPWVATENFFTALDQFTQRTAGSSMQVVQDIGGPFFHERLTAPAFLSSKGLADQKFQSAYIDYIESYLLRFGDRISGLLIHAEGSYSFFDQHPDLLDDYVGLLQRVKQSVARRWPSVRVGVNIDPHVDARILRKIAARVDVVGFDMVPIEGLLDRPEQFSTLLADLLDNTAGKPVSLACNWSSGGTAGSSDAAQVDYYRHVFGALDKHRDRIDYIAAGPPFEDDASVIAPAFRLQFSDLPESFVTDIINWSSQLGLISVNGTLKPAYLELHRLIHEHRETGQGYGVD